MESHSRSSWASTSLQCVFEEGRKPLAKFANPLCTMASGSSTATTFSGLIDNADAQEEVSGYTEDLFVSLYFDIFFINS